MGLGCGGSDPSLRRGAQEPTGAGPDAPLAHAAPAPETAGREPTADAALASPISLTGPGDAA